MTKPQTKPVHPPEPMLVAPEEAGRLLGLDKRVKDVKQKVLRMMRQGELRGVMVGGFKQVERASIDRLIRGEA